MDDCFAVIRVDDYRGNVPPEQKIKVTCVVDSQAEAEEEIARLVGLQLGRGSRYFWQAARRQSPVQR